MEKKYLKKQSQTTSHIWQKNKDSRNSSNPKQKKLKEIYAQMHHKLLKTEKEKVLKVAREK